MKFVDIPIRGVETVGPEFFNSLRSAGLAVENFLGSGFLPSTDFTIANSQAVAANVTGFVFAAASYLTVEIDYDIRRKTATNEARAKGKLLMLYRQNTAAWEVIDDYLGDDHGITWSVSAAGQLKYVSDTMAGTGYTGVSKFKATTWAA